MKYRVFSVVVLGLFPSVSLSQDLADAARAMTPFVKEAFEEVSAQLSAQESEGEVAPAPVVVEPASSEETLIADVETGESESGETVSTPSTPDVVPAAEVTEVAEGEADTIPDTTTTVNLDTETLQKISLQMFALVSRALGVEVKLPEQIVEPVAKSEECPINDVVESEESLESIDDIISVIGALETEVSDLKKVANEMCLSSDKKPGVYAFVSERLDQIRSKVSKIQSIVDYPEQLTEATASVQVGN